MIQSGDIICFRRKRKRYRLFIITSPVKQSNPVVLVRESAFPRESATRLDLTFEDRETDDTHEDTVALVFDEAQAYPVILIHDWLSNKKDYPNIFLDKQRLTDSSCADLLKRATAKKSGMPEDIKKLLL